MRNEYIIIFTFIDVIYNLNKIKITDFISPKDIKLKKYNYLNNLNSDLYKLLILKKDKQHKKITSFIDENEVPMIINLVLIVNIFNKILDKNDIIPNSNYLLDLLKNNSNKLKNIYNTQIINNYSFSEVTEHQQFNDNFYNLLSNIESVIFSKKTHHISRNDYIKIGDYWINIANLSYYPTPPKSYLLNITISNKIILSDKSMIKLLLKHFSSNKKVTIATINDNDYFYLQKQFKHYTNITILKIDYCNEEQLKNEINKIKKNNCDYHLWIDENNWNNLDIIKKTEIITNILDSKQLNNINSLHPNFISLPINFISYHLIINISSKYLNINKKTKIKPIYIKGSKQFYQLYKTYLKEPKNCESDDPIIKMISCQSFIPSIGCKTLLALKLKVKTSPHINSILDLITRKKLISCSICMSNYIPNNLVFSDCYHQLCRECLINNIYINSSNNCLKCIICRKESSINNYFQISNKKSVFQFLIDLNKYNSSITLKHIGLKTIYLIEKINTNYKLFRFSNILIIGSYPEWLNSFLKLVENNNIKQYFKFLQWSELDNIGDIIPSTIKNLRVIILNPILENPNIKDEYLNKLTTLLQLHKYDNDIDFQVSIHQLIIKDTIDEKIFNNEIVFY